MKEKKHKNKDKKNKNAPIKNDNDTNSIIYRRLDADLRREIKSRSSTQSRCCSPSS